MALNLRYKYFPVFSDFWYKPTVWPKKSTFPGIDFSRLLECYTGHPKYWRYEKKQNVAISSQICQIFLRLTGLCLMYANNIKEPRQRRYPKEHQWCSENHVQLRAEIYINMIKLPNDIRHLSRSLHYGMCDVVKSNHFYRIRSYRAKILVSILWHFRRKWRHARPSCMIVIGQSRDNVTCQFYDNRNSWMPGYSSAFLWYN